MTVCTTVYSATARTSEYSSFSFFNDKDDALRRRRSKTKHHHHIQQKHQERMSAKKKKKLSTTAMTSRRTGHQFSPLEEEKEIGKSRCYFITTTNCPSALEAKSHSTTRNDEDSSAEAKSCFVSENTRGRCLRKRRRSIVLLQITSSMAALMSNISEEKVFAASSSPEDVPKEYAEKLRSACELLLKSIEYERAHPSASVSERFAAADPAKQAVKEYIQTWQGRPETRDLETSVITGEVLRELARYYKKNGSQVALDAELRDDVVVPKLNEVLNMLPAKAPTLAERVLGISTNSSNKAN
jgi:hypothetical protein